MDHPAPPTTDAATARRGIVLLLCGLFLAALSGAIMKGLSDQLPAFLIVWFRFLGFSLLILPVVLWRHGRAKAFAPVMPKIQFLRGAMMALGTACFLISTRTLDFADAITLLYVYPFIITLLAPFLLHEPARLASFLGVAGGFLGVVLVSRPGLDGLASPGAVWALMCGALIAGQMLMNRRLGSVINPMLTSFWGAVIATALLTLLLPWVWEPITWAQARSLLLLAAMAAVSQTLVTFAFSSAPVADLAPFTYLEIVAAVGIGYAVFGTLPDLISFAGMAIIIASGVLVARIQRGRITFRRQPKI